MVKGKRPIGIFLAFLFCGTLSAGPEGSPLGREITRLGAESADERDAAEEGIRTILEDLQKRDVVSYEEAISLLRREAAARQGDPEVQARLERLLARFVPDLAPAWLVDPTALPGAVFALKADATGILAGGGCGAAGRKGWLARIDPADGKVTRIDLPSAPLPGSVAALVETPEGILAGGMEEEGVRAWAGLFGPDGAPRWLLRGGDLPSPGRATTLVHAGPRVVIGGLSPVKRELRHEGWLSAHDLKTGKRSWSAQPVPGSHLSLASTPAGLLCGGKGIAWDNPLGKPEIKVGSVNLFNPETGALVWKSGEMAEKADEGLDGMVQAMAAAQAGLLVGDARAKGASRVSLIDPATGKRRWAAEAAGSVQAVQFSPDGKSAVAAGMSIRETGWATLYRVEDGQVLHRLSAEALHGVGEVKGAAFLDGAFLLGGSRGVSLFDDGTGEVLRTCLADALPGPVHTIRRIDSDRILAAGDPRGVARSQKSWVALFRMPPTGGR